MVKFKSIYIFLLPLIGILLFMFLFNSPFDGGYTLDDLDPDKFKTCTFSSVEVKSILEKKGYNTKIQYNSTSLIPEIQNLNCIGKVEKLNFDENLVTIETLQSSRFYNLFSVLIPLSIMFIFYFKFPREKSPH